VHNGYIKYIEVYSDYHKILNIYRHVKYSIEVHSTQYTPYKRTCAENMHVAVNSNP